MKKMMKSMIRKQIKILNEEKKIKKLKKEKMKKSYWHFSCII